MILNNIDIEVCRKNIKHIHLSVYPPFGKVHVSAPIDTTDEQIKMFTLSRWMWISQKREEAQNHNIQPERRYLSGESHYYKGHRYRLKVNLDKNIAQKVYTKGEFINVDAYRHENVSDLMASWYREQLRIILEPIIIKWEELLNVHCESWEVKAMDKRWGSCSHAKKKIIFNTELCKKPLNCIEYVVLHELLHLIERTHTERFYRLLESYMPQWESVKKLLNELPV